MRNVFLLLGLLVAGGAGAEPDTFGLGSGRNGSLRVEDTGVVLNRYVRLTADAAGGTSLLTVSDSTGFVAGELVLVHQSTGLVLAPTSGEQGPIDLDGSPVGRFEYARIASVAPGELRLSAPLLHGYTGNGTQVVAVPEFTDLEVRTGASVRAEPWDGGTGGILAVLVTGRLRNDGLVTAEGAGFRGGAFLSHANRYGCTGLDEPVARGGAYKGEGLVAGRFGTASGRGNLANGGGGGICRNAGGGGGGHAGQGGVGGRSVPVDGERLVGGLGGAPVVYQPYERLLFGGGGGSGEGNNDVGTGGGAGGGLMLIRAGELRGVGLFRAAGATPPPIARNDGAGGGGAGGAISIRTRQELECGAVESLGGAGGDVSETLFPVGPGGGGGGGVVFLQGQRVECSRSVLAGAPGRTAADGGTHGSGPDSVDGGLAPGSARVLSEAFQEPGSPVLTEPVDGATGLEPRPHIEGTAPARVERVLLFLDGVPYARLTPDATGRFSYEPPEALPPGTHELRAVAELLGVHSPFSAPVGFGVVVPEGTTDGGVGSGGAVIPLALEVGCGCGASSGPGLWAGTVLLGLWAARRRRAGG